MQSISEIKPLKWAKEIIIIAGKLGIKGGLKAFSLSRDNKESIDDFIKYESIESLASACWTGQSYFQMWLNDENINDKDPLIYLDNLQALVKFDFNKLSNGVYYLEFEGNESHYWIWMIEDNELIYGGTYGGLYEISLMTHPKYEYMGRFKSAMQGSLIDYAFVFNLENPGVKSVKFSWLAIRKSPHFA